MNKETRSKYAEYLAEGIRFAVAETGLKWPEETIILVKNYHELCDIEDIIGFPIYIMDMPSPHDFTVAFPSRYENLKKLQKSFMEYTDIYEIEL